MTVTVLYSEACPNLALALARIGEAADDVGGDVTIEVVRIGPDDDAVAARYGGSPTILVDGRDPFCGSPTPHRACRLYETEAGVEGAPSVAQIAAALTRRGRT